MDKACNRQVKFLMMKQKSKTRRRTGPARQLRPAGPAVSARGPAQGAALARRSDCAVACTLDIVGDRWTLLIVRDLLGGKRYFDDFLGSPERIATNILSARLRMLQELKFIEKVPDPSDQRRSAYRFTEKGFHLCELLGQIARWGLKNLPATTIMDGIKLSPE